MVATQLILMLSSLGIKSNLAISKPTTITHKNGEYTSKESYNINLYLHSSRFMETIGFIQKYKMEAPIKLRGEKETQGSKIQRVESLGFHEVFDITVEADEHTYWTGGLLVSNCSEYISNIDGDSCNLGTIFINRVKTKDEMVALTRNAVKFLIRAALYTNRPQRNLGVLQERLTVLDWDLVVLVSGCSNVSFRSRLVRTPWTTGSMGRHG